MVYVQPYYRDGKYVKGHEKNKTKAEEFLDEEIPIEGSGKTITDKELIRKGRAEGLKTREIHRELNSGLKDGDYYEPTANHFTKFTRD